MAATRDAMKKLLANAKGFRPKFPIPLPLKPRLASVTAHQEVPLFPAKYSVEPVPHPHPFERVLVLATPEGLILRPDIPEPESGIKITYEKNCKIEVINDKSVLIGSAWGESFVIFGIVGIVRLFTDAYILVIAERTDLGYFLEPAHRVFGIKHVTSIPLDYERAKRAISIATRRYKTLPRGAVPPRPSTLRGVSDANDGHHVRFASETNEKEDDDSGSDSPTGPDSRSGATTPMILGALNFNVLNAQLNAANPAVLAKALATKLSFWNTRTPSSADVNHVPTQVLDESAPPNPSVIKSLIAPAPPTIEQRHTELEEKVVREISRQFSRGGIYYSYTFDLSTSLNRKVDMSDKLIREEALMEDLEVKSPSSPIFIGPSGLREQSVNVPLWRRTERRFWWNEHLLGDFIELGLHSYILPLLQGYWQTVSFDLPLPPPSGSSTDSETPPNGSEPETTRVEYTVISRRSRERAGVRYQRRGVDEDGNVANFVETESVVTIEREGANNIFAFVQIRGSIPLFWSQSGYNLKPAPALSTEKSYEQHAAAMKAHLTRTMSRYGPNTIVNLAEQHGKEAPLTKFFGEYVSGWAPENTQYCGYDFHAETRGMKYENISNLVAKLERVFESQGFTWILHGNVLSRQRGVFRVNCIDCLDRTNVVQSAFARHIFTLQLSAVALSPPITGPASLGMITALNDVWANNGDAISRIYAGTSALKGDFTRTGKRDVTGMLNDGMNSIARMYTSTFSDWFAQCVIDYMLGNRNISVFSEFLHKLSTTEPGALLRLSKIRLAAIETCSSRVLPENERLLYGWTLLAPAEFNLTVSNNFEEKVFLLTSNAVYIVAYDYQLEKVHMYTRVKLHDILSIQLGPYILSVLEDTSKDPRLNYGFMLSFMSQGDSTRISSYSVGNTVDETVFSPPATPTTSGIRDPLSSEAKSPDEPATSSFLTQRTAGSARVLFAAFKALPIEDSAHYVHMGMEGDETDKLKAKSCQEVVEKIVEQIAQACSDHGNKTVPPIVRNDVVSLAEAQKNATLYSKLEYNLKRLLWLGG